MSNITIFGTVPPRQKLMDNVDLSQFKKNYYKDVIKIMDQYHIYNYLKVSDPHFGLHFSGINLINTSKVDVRTSLELLYYFSVHKHESEVDPQKFEQIRLEFKEIMENLENNNN